MSADERYDIVIVGGGFNGVTTAAYLAKCGLSVCVLEERVECGGACESTEPLAGVRINPHAILMYGGPAPGFEQLELWKYGFRMDWSPFMEDLTKQVGRGALTTEGMLPMSEKDIMGWARITGMLTDPPFLYELLRATFWCPPHPPEVEVNAETIPFMQVYKKHDPGLWTEELLEMTLFDLMDEYCETEHFKIQQAMICWYSGSAAHWEGMAIPTLAYNITLCLAGRVSAPRGGMHGYLHSIFRCAVDHGAVFRTCCPVDEIIVRSGRAVGVRLRDDAATAEKTIWADKAVISDVDLKQTFNKLIGPQHVDKSLLQRVNDISLKGGSIYVSHILTREKLRARPQFRSELMGDEAGIGPYPCDSREIYFEHVADVDSRKGDPTVPPERLMWLGTPSNRFNVHHPQCTRPGQYVMSPFYVLVPPPEYHVESPDAIDKKKEEMNAYMRKAFSQVIENLDSDNIVYHWANTPYESEFRNTGLIGGTYCGTRQCDDQWWTQRPLPEMARYRTPIDGLYLCHQTAAHPGGLCLMANTYNLMHSLIEDGIAEPGDWWYPSPWYIPERGKISAVPREGKVAA
ncbi:MAG TPA: NAD(P)/FAD-dependent oxidoreductase [Dehalococcoidia bacterium]|nr:NAD(P)/FAD-dependent oxidoreductase [Dehalococcoidia bacterium]